MKEIWKDIIGYEGRYEISSFGRIKSLPRRGSPNFTYVAIRKRNGNKHYASARLCSDNKITCYNMHRLMAEHFIPNPNNLPCINHIDGDKNNFSLSNLEWCTYSNNNKHALYNGLKTKNDGVSTISKLSKDEILNVCTLLQTHFASCVSMKTGISIHIVRRIKYRLSHKEVSRNFSFLDRSSTRKVKCC